MDRLGSFRERRQNYMTVSDLGCVPQYLPSSCTTQNKV